MAIEIDATALANAVRVGDSEAEMARMLSLLSYATATISRFLGDEYDNTPAGVCNEAAIRLVAYVFDQPHHQMRGQSAMRNSGAMAMLCPWRVHRAGKVGADA